MCAGRDEADRAEVQEKVYWRHSTEASAKRDPSRDGGAARTPPRPGPAPHLLLLLLQPSGMGGFGAGTSQTGHPPQKKVK